MTKKVNYNINIFNIKDLSFAFISKILFKKTSFAIFLSDLGDASSFNLELRRYFKIKTYSGRKKLWKYLISLNSKQEQFKVIEFGVAHGDSTRWWLKNVKNPNFRYIGFDTFSGLPNNWVRNGYVYLDVNSFNNNGIPPIKNIDNRAEFIVGNVLDKSQEISTAMQGDINKIILFDMDLYEPSKFAFAEILQLLNSGDIIYFDQAFDSSNERLILREFILSNVGNWSYIGSTSIAVAFIKL